MDTAIKDGDFQTNGSGLPVRISGAQELLQRVMFRLTVKKGSFFYDQQLGSRLYTLKGSYGNREALSETAMQMVREALKPMAEVTPLGAVSYTHLDVYKRQGGDRFNESCVKILG